jgi:hypothetical protein
LEELKKPEENLNKGMDLYGRMIITALRRPIISTLFQEVIAKWIFP